MKSQTLGQRLADQIRRSPNGDAWHGPSLSEVLDGVTAKQAAAHPIAGARSIWELVLHIAIWQKHILDRIERGGMAEVSDELDWPKVAETSDAAWQAALADLKKQNELLAKVVEGRDNAKLHTQVRGRDHDFQFTRRHDPSELHHAGQIAILKKAL